MRPPSARRQAVIAIACVAVPLMFELSLRSAHVGLPLVAFFPAIAVATVAAGQIAGVCVLLASVLAAVLAMRAPPLNFTLGLSLNGMIFIGGYALSGLLIYLLLVRQTRISARRQARVGQELALSGALSRWLSRNARAAASLMRTIDGPDFERATLVARERLLMASRVENTLRLCVARDGDDLSGVMTALCQELVRAERRSDLRGVINIAPMALEHEDFIRICLVLADMLYMALREQPSSAAPLQIELRIEGNEAVMSLHWLRATALTWGAEAHQVMGERVAGRVARVLGGNLSRSPAGLGPAWSMLRVPAPAQKKHGRWRRPGQRRSGILTTPFK